MNSKNGKRINMIRGKQVLFFIGIWWCFWWVCFLGNSFFLVSAQDQEEIQIEKEKIEEETTVVRVQWKDFEESTTDGEEENQKWELSFDSEEKREELEEVVRETAVEELWEKERETETEKKTESATQVIPCNCKKTKQGCNRSSCKKLQNLIQENTIPESTAKVTEHMKTDEEGNQRIGNFSQENSEKGKEFYKIQTADETIFYLIVDRSGNNEMVYFLTDIKEKDLFHVITEQQEERTSESEATLPQEKEKEKEEEGERQTESELDEKKESKEKSGMGIFLFFSVAVVFVGGAIYFLKVYRRRGEDFEEEEEDEEEEFEEKTFEEEEKEEEDFLEE